MNVFVINGSPKGKWSITLQTVEFLRLSHPEDSFTIHHAGQRIHALEKDLAPVLEGLQAADLIVFAYPVYTFFAPSQLHRLIELIKASGIDLAGKYATQITTSKHFYDVTAHGYIEDNCHDLGLRYLRGLSADMEDLLSEQGRREAESFWTRICRSMKQGYCEPCRTVPVAADHRPVTVPSPVQKRPGDVVIITDSGAEDANLAGMIARFQAVLPVESRVVDLREYPFKSGCLGCFGCASDGKCVIKDGFDDFLRNSLQSAQAIIYAFSIRDHSMGARFKLYDDRQFCNGHRTVTEGMPMGYLISGAYRTETNLRMALEGRIQVGGNVLAGFATDESDPDGEVDRLADELSYVLEHDCRQPRNFYGVGGMRIFRDLIYQMQGMMRADHKFFKSHGQYDFPQKKKGTILKMYLVGMLMSSPTLRSKMGNKMNEGMLAPYQKVLDGIGKPAKK